MMNNDYMSKNIRPNTMFKSRKNEDFNVLSEFKKNTLAIHSEAKMRYDSDRLEMLGQKQEIQKQTRTPIKELANEEQNSNGKDMDVNMNMNMNNERIEVERTHQIISSNDPNYRDNIGFYSFRGASDEEKAKFMERVKHLYEDVGFISHIPLYPKPKLPSNQKTTTTQIQV